MRTIHSRNMKQQKTIIIVAFLIIPLILIAVFSYYPAIKLVQQSFTNWDGSAPTYKYVGFKNYKYVFTDKDVLQTFKNTFAYFVVMLFQTALALYLAIILNGKIKGKNLFKSIIFMPFILNGVAVAYMFNYMYDFNQGPINVILRSIGLGSLAIKWLPANYFINFSLAFIGMWRYTGFAMVIFLGALQSISKDMYEAANIDGANFFETVRYITIPSIKRVIELNLFLGISGSLQAFFEAYVITGGGPAGMSDTFVTKTLNTAFKYSNFGRASAMGVVLVVIVIFIIGVPKLVLGSKE